MDRENRKLRHQLDEVRERNRKLTSHAHDLTQSEVSRLQGQAEASTKGLLETRHALGRLRKSYTETVDELSHWQRKCDASDKEVKKLRLRIEELKRDLGKAEDELDEGANSVRRLQRTNEELISQMEGYQVQIEHLTSRLATKELINICIY